MTPEEYKAIKDRMSEEKCGLGGRTIKECDPPSLDNKKCSLCNKELWK